MKEYKEIWRNYEENEGIMKDIIMKKYEGNMKKYERKYEEIWRKYEEICGKYENKDSPYIWAVGLGKILRSSFFRGGEGVVVRNFQV